ASTNALHDDHGFAGAEARRLHLAHLVVRVEARRATAPQRVLATVCRLWDYVEGNAAAWPWAPYAMPGATVAPRLAALSLNEIVTELALLLAEHPELEAGALDLLAREQTARDRTVPYPYLYARAWLTLRQRLAAGEPHAAIHAAGRFLGVVDGPRPLLWYSALRDTVRFCRALSGTPARAAEILAASVPLDPALPSCLRIANQPVRIGGRPIDP
ncbi:MAG TPA: hypothetical protein VF665_25135, partial [Longimicrobium sp.]|uniref:hypothetical protein n=1 Tax=Longimicrobium sp. TaxID=2029185 RepID=UPI002EDB2832